jgi:hypothetical protein
MMVWSSLLGAIFTVVGLWMAYCLDLTSGAAIILVDGLAFMLSTVVDCLNPGSLNLDTTSLWETFPGQIDKVEIRVDGICKNCIK